MKLKGVQIFFIKVLFLIFPISFFILSVYVIDPYTFRKKYTIGDKILLPKSDNIDRYVIPYIIKNADYDAAIIGNSICTVLDPSNVTDFKTINFCQLGSHIYEQINVLKLLKSQDKVKNIFWCLSLPFANHEETNYIVPEIHYPSYLYDSNLINNGLIFFDYYTYFAAYKEKMLVRYDMINECRHTKISVNEKKFDIGSLNTKYLELNSNSITENYKKNLDIIINEVIISPKIHFTIFFPPMNFDFYSTTEIYEELTAKKYLLEKLIDKENVRFYDFQTNIELFGNNDYFLDYIHITPEVGDYITNNITIKNKHLVTKNMIPEVTQNIFQQWNLYVMVNSKN